MVFQIQLLALAVEGDSGIKEDAKEAALDRLRNIPKREVSLARWDSLVAFYDPAHVFDGVPLSSSADTTTITIYDPALVSEDKKEALVLFLKEFIAENARPDAPQFRGTILQPHGRAE